VRENAVGLIVFSLPPPSLLPPLPIRAVDRGGVHDSGKVVEAADGYTRTPSSPPLSLLSKTAKRENETIREVGYIYLTSFRSSLLFFPSLPSPLFSH